MVEDSEQEQNTQPISLQINWRGAETVPVHLGNQFLLQYTTEGYILSFGQVTPPAIIGPTAEEIQAIEEIPIVVLGRVLMTPERTLALKNLLEGHLQQFDPELLKAPRDEHDKE